MFRSRYSLSAPGADLRLDCCMKRCSASPAPQPPDDLSVKGKIFYSLVQVTAGTVLDTLRVRHTLVPLEPKELPQLASGKGR
jgi:hypothetical protein